VILSPYLSILLIAFGLALIYLFRARPGAKKKKAARAIYADMTIAADVARASARQVFGVELDLTDKSIVALDRMIAEGWKETRSSELVTVDTPAALEGDADSAAVDEDDEPEIDVNDGYYVLAGYLGTTLAHNHNGVWKNDGEHPLPYVYFKKHDFAVSPFTIIRQKLQAPQHFDLAAHYNNILWELSQLDKGVKTEEPGTKLGEEPLRSPSPEPNDV
jgi:hypothetical protein